jgi:hypothetical protein
MRDKLSLKIDHNWMYILHVVIWIVMFIVIKAHGPILWGLEIMNYNFMGLWSFIVNCQMDLFICRFSIYKNILLFLISVFASVELDYYVEILAFPSNVCLIKNRSVYMNVKLHTHTEKDDFLHSIQYEKIHLCVSFDFSL